MQFPTARFFSEGGICTFLCIYYIDDWFSYHLYLL